MIRAFRTMTCAAITLLLLSACTSDKNVCAGLREDLRRCGLPVESLDCSRIDPAAEDALAGRIDTRGCNGVAQDDSDAVDPRLCALAGWPCPVSPTPPPGDEKPRYPIVFVGGIDGTPVFDWNPRILAALERDSAIVAHHVQVTPWATTAERGADLWSSLSALRAHARSGGTKLNLICYAVGGIDCRFVASPNGLFKGDAAGYEEVLATVASITTISTPHRGTRVAEAALSALQSGAAADVLQTLLGSSAPSNVSEDAALTQTLQGLTLEALQSFNREIIDGPGIAYQSWAGVSHVLGRSSAASETSIREHCTSKDGALIFLRHKDTRDAMNEALWVTAPFASTSRDDQGLVVASPSDGMVSVESAKWGEFRGCLPADHYDVIGQIGHSARDGMTGFDSPLFFRYVASDLAVRGF